VEITRQKGKGRGNKIQCRKGFRLFYIEVISSFFSLFSFIFMAGFVADLPGSCKYTDIEERHPTYLSIFICKFLLYNEKIEKFMQGGIAR
jgi:hypothetical protein